MPYRNSDGERRPLTALTPDTVEGRDLTRLPPMTRWFEPILLCKLLLRVIISDVFGQYADRRLISAALEQIPIEQREAIELAYFGGLSQSEIAARLQNPLGTVKTRIRLGLQKLRDILTAQGLQPLGLDE